MVTTPRTERTAKGARRAHGPLRRYREKRDFQVTPEPAPTRATKRPTGALGFVVQKHAARALHYDVASS